MHDNNIIAAIATPRGNAAISVIRVSGKGSLELCDKVFYSLHGKKLSDMSGYTCTLGNIVNMENETVDTVIATVFRAPSSYTGEDSVEFSCHGGIFITEKVLECLLSAGARQAEGGEFSKRAFLNDKLGLTEAEAVMSIVTAQTSEALKMANRQAGGALSGKVSEVRERITALLVHMSAQADFSEEEIPDLPVKDICDSLLAISDECLELSGTYEGGLAVTEGIETVIAGKTNVGKSTLMNLLSGREKSIVSPTAGTTRDIVESTVICGGVVLKLSDTAGLRDAPASIEKRGVELANEKIDQSSLIIAVFDGSRPLDDSDKALLAKAPQIAIINKSDKPQKIDIDPIDDECAYIVKMCAKTGEGLKELENAVREVTGASDFADAGGWCASIHQRDCLRRAGEALATAATSLHRGFEADIAAVDIKDAINALDECTGRNATEDVIDGIFSTFCVGK